MKKNDSESEFQLLFKNNNKIKFRADLSKTMNFQSSDPN